MATEFNKLYAISPNFQGLLGGDNAIRRRRLLGVLTGCEFTPPATAQLGRVGLRFACSAELLSHPLLPGYRQQSQIAHKDVVFDVVGSFAWRPDSNSLEAFVGLYSLEAAQGRDEAYQDLSRVLGLAFGRAVMQRLRLDVATTGYAFGATNDPAVASFNRTPIPFEQYESATLPLLFDPQAPA